MNLAGNLLARLFYQVRKKINHTRDLNPKNVTYELCQIVGKSAGKVPKMNLDICVESCRYRQKLSEGLLRPERVHIPPGCCLTGWHVRACGVCSEWIPCPQGAQRDVLEGVF